MKKITQEYVNQIKEELGAHGILILATDSQLPCPDVRSGEKACKHGHEITMSIDGLSPFVIMHILENQFTKEITKKDENSSS